MQQPNQKSDVPEGASGPWFIDRIEKGPEPMPEMLEFLADPLLAFRRRVPEGEVVTRLVRKNKDGAKETHTLMMSDTPWERSFHNEVFYYAQIHGGHVLVNGLGLGLVIQGLLRIEKIEHITVVEIEQDIIDLVWDHVSKDQQNRLTLIHDDAMTWRPAKGVRYSIAWHDIWPTITIDNLLQIKKLMRSYGQRVDNWQNYWAKQDHEAQRREYVEISTEALYRNPPGSPRYQELVQALERDYKETGIKVPSPYSRE